MFNRPKKAQKTCWSILANFLAGLTPSQLLLGYLYLSGQVLGNAVNAQEAITKTYYLRGDKQRHEPSNVCISAAPGCILSVSGMFSQGKLDRFNVNQQCNPSDEVTYLGRDSLENQIKNGVFFGEKLCDATLTNTVLSDPIKFRFRHNTDYSVKLEKEDRVELTYRPLFNNPNI